MPRRPTRIPRLAQAALLMLALLLAAGPAARADGGVTADFSTDGRPVTVGDRINLVLTVQHPAGSLAVPPGLGQTWGDFSIQAVSPAQVTANPDGTATTLFQIDARLFKPGVFQTPALDVMVTDGDGNLAQAAAAPAAVTVASVLREGDNQLRDLKPQAVLPLPAVWPWVLAGCLALAALGGTFGWYVHRRRRRPAVDTRLPHERALDELSAIEAMRLPEAGRCKEHYTLVADCIRGYSEQAFGVPALQRTTGEIQADLAAAGFPPDVREALVDFLWGSDIVKFTTLTPDAAGAAGLLEQARALVHATAPRPAQPAGAGGAPPGPAHGGGGASRPPAPAPGAVP